MQTYLIAMGIIFSLIMGWVAVQYMARAYAAKHPEFGPAREEGGGCGTQCGCGSGTCLREDED